MTQARELCEQFRFKSVGLKLNSIGQILMMKTRRIHNAVRVQLTLAKILEYANQHHANNTRAARCAQDHDAPIIFHKCGRHARQRSLARLDGVCLATDQAIGIRHPGANHEIIHLVIEQHAGFTRQHARTKWRVNRQRARDSITCPINDGKMRCVGPFTFFHRRIRHTGAGRGFVRVDGEGAARGVIFVNQLLDGGQGKIRITQVARAIVIGATHRFDDVMSTHFWIAIFIGRVLQNV